MKRFGTVAALAVAMGLAVPVLAQKTEFDRCCNNCDANDKVNACIGLTGDARQSCNLRRHKASTQCMNACVKQEKDRQQIAARASQRAAEVEAARKRRAAQTPQ